MVLDDLFERFAQQSPVTVLVRAALEHPLSAQAIDALFEPTARRQYTRTLLFSSVVDLMGAVVAMIQPAVNAAYRATAEALGVSLRAVYDKLNAWNPACPPRWSATPPAPSIGSSLLGAARGRPGCRGIGARSSTATTWPGPSTGSRSFAPSRRAHGRARPWSCSTRRRCWSATYSAARTAPPNSDRCWTGCWRRSGPETSGSPTATYFCTTDFVFGIARREGGFVIRQHGVPRFIESMGQRRRCGRCETGAVFAQVMRLGDGDGGTMVVRRITVELDTPTRDDETPIPILPNLPAEVADALAIAKLYRRRGTVEAAFGELATGLNGAIDTLGDPKAAVFAFGVALVSYNVMSVVKAALRSVHGEAAVEGLSFSFLADEVAGTHRGMRIAIPEDEWAVFPGLTAVAFGGMVRDLAAGVRLSAYGKQVRGPKRPQPKRESGAKTKHVSTAKLLEKRKGST